VARREAVATFGLLLTIFGCVARAPSAVPYAVGLYITSAYWFTASTSFANPAVTIARSLSDTFAGIAPAPWPSLCGCGPKRIELGQLLPWSILAKVGEAAWQRRAQVRHTW
jgi:hypothetical protein